MGNYFGADDAGNANEDSNMASGSSSLKGKKLKNPGVTILKEILKTIKLDEHLKRQNNAILREFLFSFIDEMKSQDAFFKLLYNEFYFTGSFYSDLRISMPDEFDINLVLKLPFNSKDVQIEYHLQVPSYATIKLKRDALKASDHQTLIKKFFDEEGFLVLQKVRHWIQSVVDKSLLQYNRRLPSCIEKIIPKESGPARTLNLVKKNGGIIDIDLVPAIKCDLETKQPGIDGRVASRVGKSIKAFLVPKPFSPDLNKQLPFRKTEIPRLWRTHFPEAEKQIIHHFGCAKPVIKLLKLLRDVQNWKSLASYYLKTVVMWTILLKPDEKEWGEEKMFERFMQALTELQASLERKCIPYFFSKKNNLICKMNDREACNIKNRLKRIIEQFEKDPFNMLIIFKIQPTS